MFKTIIFMLLFLIGSNQAWAEGKTTFYHYDLLGSPVATTDEQGNVVWREEYSPWGEKLLKEDASHDNVRDYTGHVHDKETGLTYMQARYYDPQIGRFMGIDPVGFKEDNPIMFNRYAYANNNPFKFVDPNGELPFCSFCGVNQYERAITTADVLADNLPLIGNAKSAYEVKTGTNPITGEEIPDSMRVLGAVSMVAPWAKNAKRLAFVKDTRSSNKSPKGAKRKGAFREAKRASGIPVSQQPSAVTPNYDRRGKLQPGKVYEFEVSGKGGKTETKKIRDDSDGHFYGDGNDQNRGPHFNDENDNHYDY